MAKLTLTAITSGYQTQDNYNANNDLIEAAVENTLSRDGSAPNQMNSDLCMNSFDINDVRVTRTTALFIDGVSVVGGNLLTIPTASSVPNVPAGSIVALDVQAALNELDVEATALGVLVAANTAKVTNATHTGQVTGATALTITPKAVTAAMMEDGTDGELFTWDASGVLAKVPVGTIGDVLTSGGTGVAPTFQTVPTPSQNLVQVVNVQTGASASSTTPIMPDDDTIPQITEGTEYMTLAITPTNTSNLLKIEVVFNYSQNAITSVVAALFQDATADALAAAMVRKDGANDTDQITFTHYMTAGTTSSTTFRVRAGQGSGAATVTFNGQSGNRRLGGVNASSITITEYAA